MKNPMVRVGQHHGEQHMLTLSQKRFQTRGRNGIVASQSLYVRQHDTRGKPPFISLACGREMIIVFRSAEPSYLNIMFTNTRNKEMDFIRLPEVKLTFSRQRFYNELFRRTKNSPYLFKHFRSYLVRLLAD